MSHSAANLSQEKNSNNTLHEVVFDHCDSGLIVVDKSATIVLWNNWMVEHSGIKYTQAVGKKIASVFTTKISVRVLSSIQQTLKFNTSSLLSSVLNPHPFLLYTGHNGDDGDRMHQSITIKPFANPQGGRNCLIQVFDVSKAFKREKLLRNQVDIATRAKEDAERLSILKSEFISMVSHELRTPMTSIFGSLKLLQSGVIAALPKGLSYVVDIAIRNSERLLLLIDDLLDAHKIEAGKMDYTKTHLSLLNLVQQSIEMNEEYAAKFNVNFVLKKNSVDAEVFVDGNKIIQVVTNLLSNAAKFSSKKGQIIIATTLKKEKIQTSVSDCGIGISEDYRENVFARFSQADSSDARSAGGTGLGLSIAKAIIEQHDGRIWFETEVGKGTTFFFELDVCSLR